MQFLAKIKIGANGEHLPADAADHVAVLLPQVGLMFTARVVNKEEASQTELAEQCGKISVAGFTDWRMPTIDELLLAVDHTHCNPALDPAYFHDIPLDWLWTSTSLSGSPVFAWGVSAVSGFVGSLHRGGRGFALAVRSAGQ